MHRIAIVGLAVAAACAGSYPANAAPKPNALTCTSFMRDYPQQLGSFRVSFERPLTITRDLLGGEDGIDVHILSTNAGVDGTLKCKGDEFRRFESRIAEPVEPAAAANFRSFQEAALSVVFHWDKAKVGTIVGAMATDADEYLRASIERGDTYHAGKVEYHQGGGFDLGVIWTETDRTLIVTSQTDD